MRLFRFAAVALGLVATLHARPSSAAISAEERDTTFWKVAVIDFANRTPVVDGATAGVRFAASLRNSKRFHVIDPQTVRKAVVNTAVDVKNGQLTEADAKKICKALRVDGIFTGRIDKAQGGGGALTVTLYSGASGHLFAQYRFPMSAQFPITEAAQVAQQYTSRLPYDGLVVSVRSDLALINLGTANGLASGSKVYSFEIVGMTRDVDGKPNGGGRKALGELEVIRSEQHGAWIRPLRGEMPEEDTKISLRPIAGAEELKATVIAPSTAVPYVYMEADGNMGFLHKDYVLSGVPNGTAATQRYTSNATLFPAPGIHFLYFPIAAAGGEISIKHGFIPFRRPVGQGAAAHIETFSGSIDRILLEGEARKVFAGGRFAGGSISGGLGLDYTAFRIENQTPLVLSSDTYLGPVLTGHARLPIRDPLTLRLGMGIQPTANLSQSPKDNGKGSVLGLYGTLGLDYHINDKLFVAADYGLDTMSAKFPSGGGSRALQNAKQTDTYQGLTLTFGWRDYR